jgi:hypothetical protein
VTEATVENTTNTTNCTDSIEIPVLTNGTTATANTYGGFDIASNTSHYSLYGNTTGLTGMQVPTEINTNAGCAVDLRVTVGTDAGLLWPPVPGPDGLSYWVLPQDDTAVRNYTFNVTYTNTVTGDSATSPEYTLIVYDACATVDNITLLTTNVTAQESSYYQDWVYNGSIPVLKKERLNNDTSDFAPMIGQRFNNSMYGVCNWTDLTISKIWDVTNAQWMNQTYIDSQADVKVDFTSGNFTLVNAS